MNKYIDLIMVNWIVLIILTDKLSSNISFRNHNCLELSDLNNNKKQNKTKVEAQNKTKLLAHDLVKKHE